MTIYSGETVRIKSSAKGYDDAALTPSEITTAVIEIKDSTGAVVQTSTAMTYDSGSGSWFYNWVTTGRPAGSYRAKVTLTGALYNNWEYVVVRLKANPV